MKPVEPRNGQSACQLLLILISSPTVRPIIRLFQVVIRVRIIYYPKTNIDTTASINSVCPKRSSGHRGEQGVIDVGNILWGRAGSGFFL